MQEVKKVIKQAKRQILGEFIDSEARRGGYHQLYPFTTENIAGYLDLFNLKNKSLLTVGSSGDQIINAALNNCTDITLLDINPYALYYFYLKRASIMTLSRDAFLKFLGYNHNYKTPNYKVFDNDVFKIVKNNLKSIDYDSYYFWEEIFKDFPNIRIHDYMISSDEYNKEIKVACNRYLQSENLYRECTNKLEKVDINFINSNIFSFSSNKKYDNIWLSNIATSLDFEQIKKMTDIMSEYLNENGKLMISYLYNTSIKDPVSPGWKKIYHLDKVKEVLNEYELALESFLGLAGIKYNDDSLKDSVLTYTKKSNSK